MSSYIPAPATRMPQEVRLNGNLNNPNVPYMPTVGSTSILDLYRAKLIAGGTPPALVPVVMQQIVPWEFFKGQKFDLNRWLGDGVDNDNPPDGVRDDNSDSATSALGIGAPPEVAFAADPIGTLNHLPLGFQGVPPAYPSANLLRDGVLVRTNTGTNAYADGYWAKQMYARHLFCLAMLFLPDDPSTLEPVSGNNPGGTGNSNFYVPNFIYDTNANNRVNSRKLMIRRIAQWAINCVDFRDPDSAMTPFEFDYNPWDGWSVDGFVGMTPGPDGAWGQAGKDDNNNGFIDDRGDAGSGDDIMSLDDNLPIRGLVWGMEAPDLLITETLALHDRRVKDTDSGSGNEKKVTAMPPNNDDDLDQFRVPQGSVFVELNSPRPKLWPGQSINNKPPAGPLDLAYRAPAVLNGPPGIGYPLWRLAFSQLTKGTPGIGDPANPAVLASQNPESLTVDPLVTTGTRWVAPMSTVNFSAANPASTLQVDRFAYFCDLSTFFAPGSNEAKASFFANVAAGNQLLMQPGQYAVVGPRPLT
jgi:hypothetical protein